MAEEIHEHAPGTLVVGPVSRSEPGSRTVERFRSLEEYDVGGGRNAASYMDAVSWHLVAGDDQSFATVRGWMDSHLSTLQGRNPSNWEKPIFLTEIGWKSSRVGEAGQRDRIRELVHRLSYVHATLAPTKCDYPRSFLAFIYKLIDSDNEHFGIYRQDGTKKAVVEDYP